MQPDNSLPYSQKPATGSHLQLASQSPPWHSVPLRSALILILASRLRLGLLSLQVFNYNFARIFIFLLHATFPTHCILIDLVVLYVMKSTNYEREVFSSPCYFFFMFEIFSSPQHRFPTSSDYVLPLGRESRFYTSIKITGKVLGFYILWCLGFYARD